jgi:soluble lytic murein transglycosylase
MVVALQLLALPGSAQPAGEFQVARLPSAADVVPDRLGPLPRPLAFGDIVRYRQIFALQHEAKWAEADRLAAGLDDGLLLGHVLAERYTHPTAYRSSYAELAAWLGRHADHPQAAAIHRLALSRKPPHAPEARAPVPGEPRSDDRESVDGERPGARELWRQGLAAWRAGAPQAAAERFARLADDERLKGEALARAAFWVARASLRARKPRPVARFLRVAARASDEFYGLLAQRTLDETVDFDWHEEQLKESMLELLLRYPAARRAIALAHVGEPDLAEEEVGRIGGRAPRPELARALVALAASLELPSAQMRLARRVRELDGRRHDGARFPVPRWRPVGGYRLDPSLIHAIVRAESGFDPKARSPRGALGLMQVMPDTARDVAKRLRVAYAGERWLLSPANNLAVGQAWLELLAGTPTVDGDLIRLLAAYNAGEGRLAGWLQDELDGTEQDPLLFLETVPIAETRNYVKKVLANLWAYEARLGRPSPSLRALAENRWPEVAPAGVAAAIPGSKLHARAD